MQKIVKSEALFVCVCVSVSECVGLVWTVWQCEFAPVWLNLAQCVHKFHIQCAYAETGWVLLKWRCWRCCLKPTASCLSSLSFFLPVEFSFSLHFHTTVLTEGSDRLSWPVMSVGYGYRWGRNRKRESKSIYICIILNMHCTSHDRFLVHVVMTEAISPPTASHVYLSSRIICLWFKNRQVSSDYVVR